MSFAPALSAVHVAAVLGALAGGLFLLWLEPPGRRGVAPAAALLVFAAGLLMVPDGRIAWMPLAIALVAAALARDRDDVLHGECALKLLWVIGSALALSWAGLELLALATGTPYVPEQWAVLRLGLEPRFLWNTALPLSLLVGLVLLGGAPFHFWPADLFQGVRPWLAPLAVATLQAAGASWLALRLQGIEGFPPGAALAGWLLRLAALVGLVVGAVTLLAQRRPERRVGTLASLNGALVLALWAAGRGPTEGELLAWSSHLVIALTGAGTLARFLPVSAPRTGLGAPIVRRHPALALLALFALASLAGVPGTPGSWLWLDVARTLSAEGRGDLLLALAFAWLAGLWKTLGQAREAYGVPSAAPAPVRPIPIAARMALAIAGGGVGALSLARWWPG